MVIAVDVMADKLKVCQDLGADMIVDASNDRVVEEIMELTGGAGVDVAIDYVSTQGTQEQAVGSLGIGGRFVTLGGSGQPFMAPAPQMLAKELELMGSRYCSMQQVIDSLELCARGDVWPLVTETYKLEEDDYRGNIKEFMDCPKEMKNNNDLLNITRKELVTEIHE